MLPIEETGLRPVSSSFETIESFNCMLLGWDEVINDPHPVQKVETMLLEALKNGSPSPQTDLSSSKLSLGLLRWAIVKVELNVFWCEGAYVIRFAGA